MTGTGRRVGIMRWLRGLPLRLAITFGIMPVPLFFYGPVAVRWRGDWDSVNMMIPYYSEKIDAAATTAERDLYTSYRSDTYSEKSALYEREGDMQVYTLLMVGGTAAAWVVCGPLARRLAR